MNKIHMSQSRHLKMWNKPTKRWQEGRWQSLRLKRSYNKVSTIIIMTRNESKLTMKRWFFKKLGDLKGEDDGVGEKEKVAKRRQKDKQRNEGNKEKQEVMRIGKKRKNYEKTLKILQWNIKPWMKTVKRNIFQCEEKTWAEQLRRNIIYLI